MRRREAVCHPMAGCHRMEEMGITTRVILTGVAFLLDLRGVLQDREATDRQVDRPARVATGRPMGQVEGRQTIRMAKILMKKTTTDGDVDRAEMDHLLQEAGPVDQVVMDRRGQVVTDRRDLIEGTAAPEGPAIRPQGQITAWSVQEVILWRLLLLCWLQAPPDRRNSWRSRSKCKTIVVKMSWNENYPLNKR